MFPDDITSLTNQGNHQIKQAALQGYHRKLQDEDTFLWSAENKQKLWYREDLKGGMGCQV